MRLQSSHITENHCSFQIGSQAMYYIGMSRTLRVTDEGWSSQEQLSGPVKKRGRRRTLLYPHPKLSLGLVLYRPLRRCSM